jgi:pimeloyl-ACP methyl ester carboxylesterase
LLLHGLGHSSTAWLRTMRAFSRSHRVLAPDLPGHGRSGSPEASYDPGFFARIALRFVERLDLGQVDAIGSSLGALALALGALERPATFRKIALANPVGFTDAPRPPLDDALLAAIGLWLSFPRTRALVRAGYAAGFYGQNAVDDESVNEIVTRARSENSMRAARCTLRELFHFSKHLNALHARLSKVQSPVLVVWGKNDPVLPVKDVEIARRVLPTPRIEVLDRCGHLPHIERPAAFSAVVLEFLDAG